MLVTQLCPTLCNPMDCSPPGSSVPGILQERILEWVITSFSRGSSQLRDPTHVSRVSCGLAGGFFTTEPPGKPTVTEQSNLGHLVTCPSTPVRNPEWKQGVAPGLSLVLKTLSRFPGILWKKFWASGPVWNLESFLWHLNHCAFPNEIPLLW